MVIHDAYVEEREDDLYIRDLRIRLSQIVWDWLNGQDPDTIAANYPALTTAHVYGAIAYYLSHRVTLDMRFKAARMREEAMIAQEQTKRPERLQAMHARMAAIKTCAATNAS